MVEGKVVGMILASLQMTPMFMYIIYKGNEKIKQMVKTQFDIFNFKATSQNR